MVGLLFSGRVVVEGGRESGGREVNGGDGRMRTGSVGRQPFFELEEGGKVSLSLTLERRACLF